MSSLLFLEKLHAKWILNDMNSTDQCNIISYDHKSLSCPIHWDVHWKKRPTKLLNSDEFVLINILHVSHAYSYSCVNAIQGYAFISCHSMYSGPFEVIFACLHWSHKWTLRCKMNFKMLVKCKYKKREPWY